MAYRLKTPSDVRRYISNVINRCESGKLEHAKGSKLIYMANVLLKNLDMLHQHEELEAVYSELDEIERKDNG